MEILLGFFLNMLYAVAEIFFFLRFNYNLQMYIRGALGVSEDITNIEDFFEVVNLG